MKFSIRDILWLTILAALAVAWILDHRASERKRQELLGRIQVEQAMHQMYQARVVLEMEKAHYQKSMRELEAQIQSTHASIEEEARKAEGRPHWWFPESPFPH